VHISFESTVMLYGHNLVNSIKGLIGNFKCQKVVVQKIQLWHVAVIILELPGLSKN
jgi:hypothetical protein